MRIKEIILVVLQTAFTALMTREIRHRVFSCWCSGADYWNIYTMIEYTCQHVQKSETPLWQEQFLVCPTRSGYYVESKRALTLTYGLRWKVNAYPRDKAGN